MNGFMGGNRLPYFDMIRGRLDQETIRTTLGHHVHFGYWDPPPAFVESPEDFARAAERLSLEIIRTAGVRDHMRVLDVGCGFGGTLAALDRHFRPMHLVGLNLDERQLIRGKRTVLASTRNPVDMVNADACRLPFGNATFDILLAVECILHFPDRQRFFHEARRVLRPGGRLAFSDFVPSRLLAPQLRWGQRLSETMGAPQGPVDVSWTLPAYRRLANRAGFQLGPEIDITHNVLPSYPYLRRLLGEITRNPMELWSLGAANAYSEWLGRLGQLRYMILAYLAI